MWGRGKLGWAWGGGAGAGWYGSGRWLWERAVSQLRVGGCCRGRRSTGSGARRCRVAGGRQHPVRRVEVGPTTLLDLTRRRARRVGRRTGRHTATPCSVPYPLPHPPQPACNLPCAHPRDLLPPAPPARAAAAASPGVCAAVPDPGGHGGGQGGGGAAGQVGTRRLGGRVGVGLGWGARVRVFPWAAMAACAAGSTLPEQAPGVTRQATRH